MHRDLKPSNLVLENNEGLLENQINLIDFGLSAECNVDNYLFKECGTIGYFAPEIIMNQSKFLYKYTPKVDIFSAGVIFYILLTGVHPF